MIVGEVADTHSTTLVITVTAYTHCLKKERYKKTYKFDFSMEDTGLKSGGWRPPDGFQT